MTLRFVSTPDTVANFYSTFPSYGKNLAFQWDELREDLKLLNPIVRATLYENDSSQPLQDSAVTATEFGEFGFHNKYRIFWDKALGELQVQKNAGTEASPIWANHLVFGVAPDGTTLILKDVRGVVSEVGETGFGGDTSFYNVNRILFDVGSGFYLTASRDGDPVVNFTQLFGRAQSFAQTASSVEWNINHSFGTTKLQVQVFDDNQKVIMPTTTKTSKYEQVTEAAEWTIGHDLNTRNILAEAYDLTGGIRLTDQPHLKRIVVQNASVVNFYFDQPRKGFALITGKSDGIDSIDISDPNTANFYFSSARQGSVMISSGAQGIANFLTTIVASDGINAHTTTQLNFNTPEFYLSTNALGQPQVNLNELDEYVRVDGTHAFTGDQSMGDNQLTNLGAPIADTDAARLADVKSAGPGFYGVIVRESEAGGYEERDDRLTFDSDFFYLASDASGKPFVSLTSSVGGVSDHGALTGLSDDDHTQYSLADGSRDFTGDQSMGGNELTNVGQPTAGSSAARLQDIGPGFYGIVLKESEAGGYSEQDDQVTFDSDFFYLASDASGKPLVSFHETNLTVTSGETNTGSSLGGDEDIFKQKTGVDLEFKGLSAGTNITLSSSASAITINSTASGGGGGGFYGVYFKESEAGGYEERDDTLIFNSDEFYLSSNAEGKPLVSLVSSGGSGASDHGALTGLSDDDHTQYALIDGTRAFTGHVRMEDTLNVENAVTAEAYYLGAGGQLSMLGDDLILNAPGYVQVNNNLVAGDPGGEGDAISVAGSSFASELKATDIGSANPVDLHLHKHSTSLPAVLAASRTKSNTNSHTAVDAGDSLFSLLATGRGDSTYEVAARVDFLVEDVGLTPGDNQMPGMIKFRTQAPGSGSTSGALAMTIHSDQHIGMESSLDVKNKVTAEAFYLTTGGELTVSVGSSVSKVSEAFGSSVEWQMSHGLGVTAPQLIWATYNDGMEAVIPAKVDVSTSTAYFYFSEATAGTAVVVG